MGNIVSPPLKKKKFNFIKISYSIIKWHIWELGGGHWAGWTWLDWRRAEASLRMHHLPLTKLTHLSFE